MGKILYRPVLSDILIEDLRDRPGDDFLFRLPDRRPGVRRHAGGYGRKSSFVTAFCYALLFGALAYGTYDLTNYATLRHWTLQITIIDICYGALASAIAATVAALVARAFSN